jgi:phospholipase A1
MPCNRLTAGFIILLLSLSGVLHAAPDTQYEACVLEQVAMAPELRSAGEIRQHCKALSASSTEAALPAETKPEPPVTTGAVARRFAIENATDLVRFVITPHKPNYLIYTYNFEGYNDDLLEQQFNENLRLRGGEVDFQVSFKFPVIKKILNTGPSLMFAYTNRSFWQLFDSRDSSPFRETNHEPEAWLTWYTDWKVLGFTNRAFDIGLVHQSNGRGGVLSRSWNRVYARFVMERGNAAFAIKPWYRIPERKEDDDNRDIEEYLGNFEFQGVYKHKNQLFELFFRNRLKDDYRGALQLGWSFPVTERLNGYVQYYYGYGESLIDYNNKVNKLGIGIKLTDWL